MTTRPSLRIFLALVPLATVVGLSLACSLNPQPFPPEQLTGGGDDAGTTGGGSGGGGGSSGLGSNPVVVDAGVANESDAAAPFSGDAGIFEDGGVGDGGVGDGGVGDGGDGGLTDGGDAGGTIDDGGDAG